MDAAFPASAPALCTPSTTFLISANSLSTLAKAVAMCPWKVFSMMSVLCRYPSRCSAKDWVLRVSTLRSPEMAAVRTSSADSVARCLMASKTPTSLLTAWDSLPSSPMSRVMPFSWTAMRISRSVVSRA